MFNLLHHESQPPTSSKAEVGVASPPFSLPQWRQDAPSQSWITPTSDSQFGWKKPWTGLLDPEQEHWSEQVRAETFNHSRAKTTLNSSTTKMEKALVINKQISNCLNTRTIFFNLVSECITAQRQQSLGL